MKHHSDKKNSSTPEALSKPDPLGEAGKKAYPPLDAVVAISVDHFCVAVNVSRSLTYSLIKQEKLKAVKIAGRTLIPVAEVRRLVGEAA